MVCRGGKCASQHIVTSGTVQLKIRVRVNKDILFNHNDICNEMQISVLEMQIYVFNLEIKISAFQIQVSSFASGKHAYIFLTHLNPSFI